jgi:epsilon-lactone hydrolase
VLGLGHARPRLELHADEGPHLLHARRHARGAGLHRRTHRAAAGQAGLGRGQGADAARHLHGGAFTYGSSNTHRALVSRLARRARVRALLIDYRLAPEHPFPAALEDCLASYRWLLAQGFLPHRIAVGGDSAGANLTLSLTLALRQEHLPLPACLACLSPVSDLSQIQALTPEVVASDPILVEEDINLVMNYANGHDLCDPLLSPALGDLHGLPPALIHVGGEELLRADARQLCERLQRADVDARLEVWAGMWHVFQAYAPYLPEARRSIEELGSFIHASLACAPDINLPEGDGR